MTEVQKEVLAVSSEEAKTKGCPSCGCLHATIWLSGAGCAAVVMCERCGNPYVVLGSGVECSPFGVLPIRGGVTAVTQRPVLAAHPRQEPGTNDETMSGIEVAESEEDAMVLDVLGIEARTGYHRDGSECLEAIVTLGGLLALRLRGRGAMFRCRDDRYIRRSVTP